MLTSNQIRRQFIEFFESKGHTFVPSSPVVPHDDPTLLFANAGMNQFKDVFLDTGSRPYTRAANSQKCIRVSGKHNDLEEVGRDTYHHTFFEMLGNWSLGDYFKREAIQWAWELLVDVWKLPADKLWVTVFGGDEAAGLEPDTEAERLWPELTGISPERVLRFGKKDNFWEMGDTGPCGPCSEIHLDRGPEYNELPGDDHGPTGVNSGSARYIEIWNLVFIQFNNDGQALTPLPARHVDTGMGLERITAYLQNVGSNYDTDLFMPIIRRISELAGYTYKSTLKDEHDIACRVIADHVRALTFAITDGATPSNEGRGYVLRRILRRAARYGRTLNQHDPFIYKVVPAVVDVMGEAFPEVASRADYVAQVIEAEEASFGRTLDRGLELFNNVADRLAASGEKTFPGDDAFRLYDTYGFPVDLTALLAEERGMTVDHNAFDTHMQQQRDRARAAGKSDVVGTISGDALPYTDDEPKYTEFPTSSATVAGWVVDNAYTADGQLSAGTDAALVLDRTNLYAESGGQVGDVGTITTATGVFEVADTQKSGQTVLHVGTVREGTLSAGQPATSHVSTVRRDTMRNHTATHIMQWALREVLGDHAAQQGSLVSPDYLRFDFTHPKAMTDDEIQQVEQMVNEAIRRGHYVTWKVMPIEEGRKLGAMALFGEKYGDTVRVVCVGADEDGGIGQAFSREFCGGTHVSNTADIGAFKIVREESVATGVRRITARTGRALLDLYEQRYNQVEELVHLLKAKPDQVVERVQTILKQNKDLEKKAKQAGQVDLAGVSQAALDGAEKIGDVSVIAHEYPEVSVEQLRGQADWLRQKSGSAVILLGTRSDGKAMLLGMVTDDLIKKGLKAGDMIREAAAAVDGKGGGRPQMAQAGGKSPDKLPDALAVGKTWAKDKLT